MNDEQTPINPQSTRRRGPLTVLVDLGLGFQERVLWRIGDGLRALPGAILRPFEWIGWTVRRALIWPLADRLALLSGPGRALAIAASPLVVVGIAAGVYFATNSGTTGNPAAEPAAVVSAAPVARASAAPQPKPAEPTLHGASPVFAPTRGKAANVRAPKAPERSAAAKDSSSAATAASAPSPSSAATGKISSRPAAPGSVGAEVSAIPGRPAGAKALAVAREFSGAFVVYETEGKSSDVRKAFAGTTTPELAKALLKRPPRQPADVNVPQAKVLNIVPGPSRGSVYTVSVSLLRVGVTSELRLEMEKLKDEGWRVTNVLG